MSDGELVAAVVLGLFGLLVVGGILFSIQVWARRRRALRQAAEAAGFSPVDDPQRLLSAGFREFRAATSEAPGMGRFENVLRRRSRVSRDPGDTSETFLCDYSEGSSAGTALLPHGTYACFLDSTRPWPTIRFTPRPAPRLPLQNKIPGQTRPVLERIEVAGSDPAADPSLQRFARLYAVEGESRQAVEEFLTPAKIEALVEADPPWLVETGAGGVLLARRPGGRSGRKFHRLAPEELPEYAEAATRMFQVLRARPV